MSQTVGDFLWGRLPDLDEKNMLIGTAKEVLGLVMPGSRK